MIPPDIFFFSSSRLKMRGSIEINYGKVKAEIAACFFANTNLFSEGTTG
jgi:hypothetical protein